MLDEACRGDGCCGIEAIVVERDFLERTKRCGEGV